MRGRFVKISLVGALIAAVLAAGSATATGGEAHPLRRHARDVALGAPKARPPVLARRHGAHRWLTPYEGTRSATVRLVSGPPQ